jgi:hypothetical protein
MRLRTHGERNRWRRRAVTDNDVTFPSIAHVTPYQFLSAYIVDILLQPNLSRMHSSKCFSGMYSHQGDMLIKYMSHAPNVDSRTTVKHIVWQCHEEPEVVRGVFVYLH